MEVTMPASETGTPSPWWYVIGTIVATLVGAILKTFVDLVGRRDSSAEKWRADLLQDIKGLRDWNDKQQHELNDYRSRLDKMGESVLSEQSLRHDLRGQLGNEKMEHEILKTEYVHLQKEHEDLKMKYEDLKVNYVAMCGEAVVVARDIVIKKTDLANPAQGKTDAHAR